MMESFTDVFKTAFITGWIILLGGMIMYLSPSKRLITGMVTEPPNL